jgi:hypothetical protein
MWVVGGKRQDAASTSGEVQGGENARFLILHRGGGGKKLSALFEREGGGEKVLPGACEIFHKVSCNAFLETTNLLSTRFPAACNTLNFETSEAPNPIRHGEHFSTEQQHPADQVGDHPLRRE